MQTELIIKYLKGFEKKPHVISELVQRVERLNRWLQKKRHTGIDGATRSVLESYHDGGYDTLEKIAMSTPEEICISLIDYVIRTGFTGIAPFPEEAKNTVVTARQLTKIVTYEE